MPGNSGPVGVETDAALIRAALDDLRRIASDPEKSTDDDRIYSFKIRWGSLMSGRLKRLEHYYRAGKLTQNQEGLYRDLRGDLREVAPEAERLGIGPPTVPLDD